MTAWSSYQEFLGLGARLGLPLTMKLGHDSKWVKYVDLRPAQNAASLIPWSWRSKHYQAMPVLWFVRLQSLLVSVKPSIRYCQPVSINKLWKCPEIINVHWRISWQFYLLIIDLLQSRKSSFLLFRRSHWSHLFSLLLMSSSVKTWREEHLKVFKVIKFWEIDNRPP